MVNASVAVPGEPDKRTDHRVVSTEAISAISQTVSGANRPEKKNWSCGDVPLDVWWAAKRDVPDKATNVTSLRERRSGFSGATAYNFCCTPSPFLLHAHVCVISDLVSGFFF